MELAGKMPVGAGQGILPGGVNLSFRTAGDEGGEEFHRLEVDEMPSHDHQFPYAGIYDGPGGGSVGGNNLQRMAGSEGTTNAKGGNNPHNNMPPFRVVHFCRRK